MYKIVKAKFLYQGKQMNYREIQSSIDEITRCRKLRLHYKRAEVMLEGIAVTLFFTRQGKGGKWKVFLTTDTKLSFVKLMEIYQIRWSIEVFFNGFSFLKSCNLFIISWILFTYMICLKKFLAYKLCGSLMFNLSKMYC